MIPVEDTSAYRNIRGQVPDHVPIFDISDAIDQPPLEEELTQFGGPLVGHEPMVRGVGSQIFHRQTEGIVAIRGGADAAMADAKEQPALGIALSLANMFFTALKNVVIDRAIRGSARRTAGERWEPAWRATTTDDGRRPRPTTTMTTTIQGVRVSKFQALCTFQRGDFRARCDFLGSRQTHSAMRRCNGPPCAGPARPGGPGASAWRTPP